MTLGYLVPEFPDQTHAFFWREIGAFEEAGTGVRIYSTRRPAPESCPHAFAQQAMVRTTYLFPPRIDSFIARLLTHPLRTLRASAYIMRLDETPIKARLKLLGLLPSATTLVADARKAGVTHLHIHSCANAAHLGALANILDDLPYSLTLHGDLPVYGADHAAKMKRANFVAAVTRPLSRQVLLVSPATDAPVIWMGVNCASFSPGPCPNNQIFTVATIARLNHVKGHRFFLRAMARLRDQGRIMHYKIAGDGPEKAAIEAEIRQLGLESQVEMLGALNEAAVLDLLNRADALALTSIGKGEAAPVTVMEAMACGLPVICSRIGGTPDMIEDGTDGFLVEQQDVATIAKLLLRMADEPELVARIGSAARANALVKFDYQINARKLLDRITFG
ncbi:glycosyltransferase [Pontibaca salina]|uniref:Glycosyltransferase n=1 Tax=Pontibaca salina TaxID=2795731 RepID=A0A934HS99_9RHOB|nr:glycosyltransferase [Pontibaca salina]MBI6630857.1 glycosyltransferase [Pontibaca salina]